MNATVTVESMTAGPRAGTPARDACGPQRRCIATGEVHRKDALLRFVVGPDGVLVPDIEGRLPGRGLWLTPARDIIAAARTRRLFAKAARAPVTVPDDLADRVERLLVRRCLDLIGLAKRCGQAMAGHEKVRAWLSGGKAAMLLQAVDAAEGGRHKLRALAAVQDPAVPVIELFTAAELGRAFGATERVHVVLAPGGIATRLTTETARLAGLRGGEPQTGARGPER